MFAGLCVCLIYVYLSAFPHWRREPQLHIATDVFLAYSCQTLTLSKSFSDISAVLDYNDMIWYRKWN